MNLKNLSVLKVFKLPIWAFPLIGFGIGDYYFWGWNWVSLLLVPGVGSVACFTTYWSFTHETSKAICPSCGTRISKIKGRLPYIHRTGQCKYSSEKRQS
jgi:hypothetical protein